MVALSASRHLKQAFAAIASLLIVPAILSASGFFQDAPIRQGEPSPRTVIAPELIRINNPTATDRARRDAAAAVAEVVVPDDEARAQIVQQVRDVFDAIREVRQPGADGTAPSRVEQIAALRDRLRSELDENALTRAVALSDAQLQQTGNEAVEAARQLARLRIDATTIDRIRAEQIASELLLRSLPPGAADDLVAPVISLALRPTVAVDAEATQEARDAAAAAVAPVVRTFTEGQVIVSAGARVDAVQFAALRDRGLQGGDPLRTLLRAIALSAVITLAVTLYLRAYRRVVWTSGNLLLLLGILFVLFAITLEGVNILARSTGPAIRFLIPAGAVAMLATILLDPPVGVLLTIPITVLAAFGLPGEPGIVVFVALSSLASVPLVSRLSARGDLRRAAWQATLGYGVLAGVLAGVFAEPAMIIPAIGAGLANGLLTAVIVNGMLPFLESVFGILTATSLLDLADRNHPLLRALEQKALGSYNHSIMVSTLVERAARAIKADGLLASTAALYHDIGKVANPYFFVENQFGIPNPHEALDPRASAIIIQNHVTDGIEMARVHRLPAEVVEGIASHHGTTLVSYFHRQAVQAAGGDPDAIDEGHFRYKGRKPASKEMAILMLADCCEGASRAAAQHNRSLSQDDLEGIVISLLADRVEDGQLDESSLTFAELRIVQASFIETLVGVYHPRIPYPDKPKRRDKTAVAALPEGEADVAALNPGIQADQAEDPHVDVDAAGGTDAMPPIPHATELYDHERIAAARRAAARGTERGA